MSDTWIHEVPGAGEKGRAGHTNQALTKSANSPVQPSHSRNSSWNIHGGLFNELDGFPSVSTNNQGNAVTSDDVISAECFGGYTSPVRRPVRRPVQDPGENTVSHRRSVTPQKTGVRGVAMRLASCEKAAGERRLGGVAGESFPSDADPSHVSVQSIQMDSAPRTRYTGILKRLEFQSGGYTAEHVQNTSLIFSRLKETLEERGTPVGVGSKSGGVQQHRTPIEQGARETATKKLMFTMTSSGEGGGSWEHGGGSNLPGTVPSSMRFRGSARRVTFGRVSMDDGRRQPIMEDDREGGDEVGDGGSDGFSFQTMTYSAGSTPYSGKTHGERRRAMDGAPQVVTKDQLASALKKSLTFAGTDDVGGGTVEKQFSFGWDRFKQFGQREGDQVGDQASTPGFSTFKPFKTTSRRFLTPPSQSPSLLELHGKARRVSGADGTVYAELGHEPHDENTPVEEDAPDSKVSKLSKFTLPRRLDVTERGTIAREGTSYAQLSSPTEVGIRNSLKQERTKRLMSASRFNSTSS